MAEDLDDENFYEILGVPETATQEEIRRAYHALARQYHPDKNPDDPEAAEKIKAINNAYDTLGDENKRQVYDAVKSLEFIIETLLKHKRAEVRTQQTPTVTKCEKVWFICCGIFTGCYCCFCCCGFCCGRCVPKFLKDEDDSQFARDHNTEDLEASGSRAQSPIISEPMASSSGLFQTPGTERTSLIAKS